MKSVRFLILSCNTGQGHNSAANALREEALRQGHEMVIVDALSLGARHVGNLTSGVYNRMIRKAPRLFGVVYRASNVMSATRLPSPSYPATRRCVKGLKRYVEENRIDAVFSTHLFGMEIVTAARRRGNFHIPCFAVLTDYTCVPFLSKTRQDLYFIAHDDLRSEMIRRRIPDERIRSCGIPIRRRFAEPIGKQEARRRLQLPQHIKIYLVMTGGEGSGNAAALCRGLLNREKEPFRSIVLSGRNRVLKEEIERTFADVEQVQNVSFTEDVNLYMEAADVILSKAGGLSSTEIAALGVPLVHTMAIPGLETKNADFFSRRFMSMWAKDAEEAINGAWSLAHQPSLSERMREEQLKNIHADAAERIIREATRAIR